MEHDLNNLNQFLGENDSPHFPNLTHQRTIRKSSTQIKQHQYIMSPINNIGNVSTFRTPSPFNHNIYFYEEEHSCSQDYPQMALFNPRKKSINQVLNFDESPRKRTSPLNTSFTTRLENKNQKFPLFCSNGREQKKNSKGLRTLSQSVYKIVLNLKVTTYKQVAEYLVKMLNSGEFGTIDGPNSKEKNQQNIKRRVYDALNVLISADVLKRNQKYVVSNQQEILTERLKYQNKMVKKQDQINLQEQIIKKERSIKKKKQRVDELRNKKLMLNAILKRNGKKIFQEKQKILFPFVGITSIKTLPNISVCQSHSQISLSLINTVEVIGDLDLLSKVPIDILNQSIQQIIEQANEDEVEINNFEMKQKIKKVLYFL